jgi:hypothetical protein
VSKNGTDQIETGTPAEHGCGSRMPKKVRSVRWSVGETGTSYGVRHNPGDYGRAQKRLIRCHCPLKDAGKGGSIVTRVDVYDTVGQETGLGEGWCEEVLACNAPQHFAPRARSDSRGEQRSCGTVARAIAATGDFMQRPKR